MSSRYCLGIGNQPKQAVLEPSLFLFPCEQLGPTWESETIEKGHMSGFPLSCHGLNPNVKICRIGAHRCSCYCRQSIPSGRCSMVQLCSYLIDLDYFGKYFRCHLYCYHLLSTLTCFSCPNCMKLSSQGAANQWPLRWWEVPFAAELLVLFEYVWIIRACQHNVVPWKTLRGACGGRLPRDWFSIAGSPGDEYWMT